MTFIEQFKRGGRGFTLSEWGALSAEDQAIAIEVQTALDQEFSAWTAYFLVNPKAMFAAIGLNDDVAVRAVLEGRVR